MKEPSAEPQFNVYFLSFIVGGRKHLLTNEACAQAVLNSLAWLCQTGQILLYGYVLLPSCVYFLCRPVRKGIQSLADSLAEFTANRMVNVLRRRNRGPLMHYLVEKVPAGTSGAPVWGEVRIRAVRDGRDAMQVLEFMHRKPVMAEWRLASAPGEYLYSSACYYEDGRQPILEVEDIWKVFVRDGEREVSR
jgi:hypothetical protein